MFGGAAPTERGRRRGLASDDADGGELGVLGALLGRVVDGGLVDEQVLVDLGVAGDRRDRNVGGGGVDLVEIDGDAGLRAVGAGRRRRRVLAAAGDLAEDGADFDDAGARKRS